jgi:hypothetical protein
MNKMTIHLDAQFHDIPEAGDNIFKEIKDQYDFDLLIYESLVIRNHDLETRRVQEISGQAPPANPPANPRLRPRKPSKTRRRPSTSEPGASPCHVTCLNRPHQPPAIPKPRSTSVFKRRSHQISPL